jgi:hypothetical protein
LLFIVRAFFNDTITVAVWTGFHVRLTGMLSHTRDYIRWCIAGQRVRLKRMKKSPANKGGAVTGGNKKVTQPSQ